MPASSRSRDDFPLPDGPMTAVSLASENAKVMPFSARTSLVGVR